MSKMPSMVALLGLLAVAGYQNRDKLSGMLQGATGGAGGTGPQPGGARKPGLLSELGGLFGGGATGGATAGGTLADGLGSLVDRFRNAGKGDVADSWVKSGPNQPLTPETLKQALDDDTMIELEQKTGLTHDEILARLSKAIPEAVDHYTPDGHIPSHDEASRLV